MNQDFSRPAAVDADLSAESDQLFIAFGSLRLDREVPPFEYVSSFRDLPVKKILLRDLHKLFFLRGLPDISNNILETRDYLQDICKREAINWLVVFGGSAGGYTALLMGWLLRADEVHAFAPITFLPTRKGWGWLELVHERKWKLLMKQLQLKFDPHLDRTHYDLQAVLSHDNGKTNYNIYYGVGHRHDWIRCQRMKGLPGVRLLEYDYDNHHIDRHLKERGEWSRIFQEAIL